MIFRAGPEIVPGKQTAGYTHDFGVRRGEPDTNLPPEQYGQGPRIVSVSLAARFISIDFAAPQILHQDLAAPFHSDEDCVFAVSVIALLDPRLRDTDGDPNSVRRFDQFCERAVQGADRRRSSDTFLYVTNRLFSQLGKPVVYGVIIYFFIDVRKFLEFPESTLP